MLKNVLCAMLALVLLVPVNLKSAAESDTFDTDFISYISSIVPDDNFVASPLSFRAALLLALEGAAGETETQLLHMLGFDSKAAAEKWYACVEESIKAFDDYAAPDTFWDKLSPQRVYRILNSVWVNLDLSGEFRNEYAQAVQKKYSAEIRSERAANITNAVNDWCGKATGGLIPKIADDLSANTSALVNAVYLKSAWATAFEEYFTSPKEFTCADGSVTTKLTMKAKDRYRYYEDDKTKLVVLHIEGGLDFVAVLGDDSDWMDKYAAAQYDYVDLWLPKLDTESTFGADMLLGFLKECGAVNAYDPLKADFSVMSDSPWFIESIIQKARIKTDENGLEAAAVTAVLTDGAVAVDAPEPVYRIFHADRPFRYYITAASSAAPLVLFAGQEVK
ncbi:MAG: hypothetical protein IKR85_11185 [Clostridia bacterium]|nr:hypothetical protein [Clostridia bacterium]